MEPRPNIKPNTDIQDMISSSSLSTSFAKLMADSADIKSFSGGLMPMITLRGFIDITTVETLCDPSRHWILTNRIAQHYGVWREWGDVPRACLPEEPSKEMLDRVARISVVSQRKAQELIDASAVEAAFKAQGRENALRLFDPPGTRYYYR
jgi:hypothetical protein